MEPKFNTEEDIDELEKDCLREDNQSNKQYPEDKEGKEIIAKLMRETDKELVEMTDRFKDSFNSTRANICTVKQLREYLSILPDNADVLFYDESKGNRYYVNDLSSISVGYWKEWELLVIANDMQEGED